MMFVYRAFWLDSLPIKTRLKPSKYMTSREATLLAWIKECSCNPGGSFATLSEDLAEAITKTIVALYPYHQVTMPLRGLFSTLRALGITLFLSHEGQRFTIRTTLLLTAYCYLVCHELQEERAEPITMNCRLHGSARVSIRMTNPVR
jgi:hypothetical protein